MSARNTLENKAKRREHRNEHKAVPRYHEVRPDRNKYAPVNQETFVVDLAEDDLTEKVEE